MRGVRLRGLAGGSVGQAAGLWHGFVGWRRGARLPENSGEFRGLAEGLAEGLANSAPQETFFETPEAHPNHPSNSDDDIPF